MADRMDSAQTVPILGLWNDLEIELEEMQMRTTEKEKCSNQLILFRAAFLLFVTATFFQTTMYTQYAILSRIFQFMRYIAFGMLSVLIASHIWSNITGFVMQKGMDNLRQMKYTILCICVIGFTAMLSWRIDNRTPLFAAAFLLAARKQYLNPCFRAGFRLLAVLIAVTVCSSLLGLIPDILIKRETIPIRHSLGFTYPSVCTGYFYFLLLLYLWNSGGKVSKKDLVWIEAVNVLIYILTDTRIVFLLASMLVLAAYLFGCRDLGKIIDSRLNEMKRSGSILYQIYLVLYDYFTVLLFLFYTMLCILDQAFGGNSILDRILSGRLGLSASAIRNYGIHIIPGMIKWVGFGGTENTDVLLATYNFVDCSYVYILVSYGLLIFAAVMVYLVLLQKYVRKTETIWKQMLLLFVWTYCLVEPRLLEIHMNYFLLLGVPVLYLPGKRRGMKRNG